MKILLVDDNPKIRRMMMTMLESVVDEFIECADGSEALEAYAAHNPDLVLMDIEMNGIDGITAMRQIRQGYPDAKIIIVTNYGDAALRQAAEEAGAFEYVLKEDLKRVLEIIRLHHDVETDRVPIPGDQALERSG